MKAPAATRLALGLALLGPASAWRSRQDAVHGRRAARGVAGGVSYGDPKCSCIGIEYPHGEIYASLGNGTVHPFPADFGSHCSAWSDGRNPLHCREGQNPGKGNGWCAQPWCFVDPCKCEGLYPEVTKYLPDATYQGKAMYYSYATCGGEDTWTAKKHEKACKNAKTEEACGENQMCMWSKGKCVGWEVGGFCLDLPEESDWGKADCPCIHMSGINGTMVATLADGQKAEFPAELGSMCKAWDEEVIPSCKGDKPAEGCSYRWCYVDSRNCKKVDGSLKKSTYLQGATFQGEPLHYSYATCGSKQPLEPPQAELKMGNSSNQTASVNKIKVEFDNEAYKKEWHEEWQHGKAPAFRDQYPEVARAFEDRQSDGKPSPPR